MQVNCLGRISKDYFKPQPGQPKVLINERQLMAVLLFYIELDRDLNLNRDLSLCFGHFCTPQLTILGVNQSLRRIE